MATGFAVMLRREKHLKILSAVSLRGCVSNPWSSRVGAAWPGTSTLGGRSNVQSWCGRVQLAHQVCVDVAEEVRGHIYVQGPDVRVSGDFTLLAHQAHSGHGRHVRCSMLPHEP